MSNNSVNKQNAQNNTTLNTVQDKALNDQESEPKRTITSDINSPISLLTDNNSIGNNSIKASNNSQHTSSDNGTDSNIDNGTDSSTDNNTSTETYTNNYDTVYISKFTRNKSSFTTKTLPIVYESKGITNVQAKRELISKLSGFKLQSDSNSSRKLQSKSSSIRAINKRSNLLANKSLSAGYSSTYSNKAKHVNGFKNLKQINNTDTINRNVVSLAQNKYFTAGQNYYGPAVKSTKGKTKNKNNLTKNIVLSTQELLNNQVAGFILARESQLVNASSQSLNLAHLNEEADKVKSIFTTDKNLNTNKNLNTDKNLDTTNNSILANESKTKLDNSILDNLTNSNRVARLQSKLTQWQNQLAIQKRFYVDKLLQEAKDSKQKQVKKLKAKLENIRKSLEIRKARQIIKQWDLPYIPQPISSHTIAQNGWEYNFTSTLKNYNSPLAREQFGDITCPTNNPNNSSNDSSNNIPNETINLGNKTDNAIYDNNVNLTYNSNKPHHHFIGIESIVKNLPTNIDQPLEKELEQTNKVKAIIDYNPLQNYVNSKNNDNNTVGTNALLTNISSTNITSTNVTSTNVASVVDATQDTKNPKSNLDGKIKLLIKNKSTKETEELVSEEDSTNSIKNLPKNKQISTISNIHSNHQPDQELLRTTDDKDNITFIITNSSKQSSTNVAATSIDKVVEDNSQVSDKNPKQTKANRKNEDLHELEVALRYKFNDISHLRRATTHASYNHNESYERYEFLGDSIMNMIVARWLFNNYSELTEGQLTKLRSGLICTKSVSAIAHNMNLGSYMLFSKGEIKNGGRHRASVLEDCVEAICGAIFIDSGSIEAVEQAIIPYFASIINAPQSVGQVTLDSKSFIQEVVQELFKLKPVYVIIRTEGKAHNQMFYVRCEVPNKDLFAIGAGSSKRKAEQVAAAKLLKKIKDNNLLPDTYTSRMMEVITNIVEHSDEDEE